MLSAHLWLELRLCLKSALVYAAITFGSVLALAAMMVDKDPAQLRLLVCIGVPVVLGCVASESCAREARGGVLGFRKRLPGSLTTMLAGKLLVLVVPALLLALAGIGACILGATWNETAPVLSLAELPGLALAALAFAAVVAMLAVWLGASSLLVPGAALFLALAVQPVAIELVLRPWLFPGPAWFFGIAAGATLFVSTAALVARALARFEVLRSAVVVATGFVLVLGGTSFALAPEVESWDRFEMGAKYEISSCHLSADMETAWLSAVVRDRDRMYCLRVDLEGKRYARFGGAGNYVESIRSLVALSRDQAVGPEAWHCLGQHELLCLRSQFSSGTRLLDANTGELLVRQETQRVPRRYVDDVRSALRAIAKMRDAHGNRAWFYGSFEIESKDVLRRVATRPGTGLVGPIVSGGCQLMNFEVANQRFVWDEVFDLSREGTLPAPGNGYRLQTVRPGSWIVYEDRPSKGGRRMRLYDPETAKVLPIEGLEDDVRFRGACLPDGRLLCVSADGAVFAFDPERKIRTSFALRGELPGPLLEIGAWGITVPWSQEGAPLAIGRFGKQGHALLRFDVPNETVRALVLPGNARVLTASESHGVYYHTKRHLVRKSWDGQELELLFPCREQGEGQP